MVVAKLGQVILMPYEFIESTQIKTCEANHPAGRKEDRGRISFQFQNVLFYFSLHFGFCSGMEYGIKQESIKKDK
jgi:hypothetical protein